MKCRLCRSDQLESVIDLGNMPLSNAILSAGETGKTGTAYPLKLLLCNICFLLQTEDFIKRDEIFNEDYPYFSSVSRTWLRHAEKFVTAMIERFSLGKEHRVAEVASNDGYLLQYFLPYGIPVLGIEPSESVALAAEARGVPTQRRFMGENFARSYFASNPRADLLIANNVLAHVPDLSDFISGLKHSLAVDGVLTVEFPYLLNLLKFNQFDTIYHEHFSYFTLTTAAAAFRLHNLEIFDLEQIPTHGGSLRLYVKHAECARHSVTTAVDALLREEQSSGLFDVRCYRELQASAESIRADLLSFLIGIRDSGKRCMAYGAAAKGNTLLNFAGIGPDLIECVADQSPAKQGRYMPGSRIPIVSPVRLREQNPDFILILPWNIQDEIRKELDDLASTFFVAIPKLGIL